MLNYIHIEIMAHRKRNEDGYVLPKTGASVRTNKRWDSRHNYDKPEDTGFKKLDDGNKGSPIDTSSVSFKPMKKVDL